MGSDGASNTSLALNSCKDFHRAVNSPPRVVAGAWSRRRVTIAALSLAGGLGLLLSPAGALADSAAPLTASPTPSPSASPSPAANPFAPSPKPSASPTSPGLQNRQAQGQ